MTTSTETIADGLVVSFHYTLRDDDGEILDSSEGDEPLKYLHGAGNIVPGLEEQLTGKRVGDKVAAVVDPKDGYGEVEGEPQAVPRSAFPADAELEEGMPVYAQGPDGEVIPLWVKAIEGDQIFVDPNHPLAGVALHFDVEITEIREASQLELDHGHPHEPGTHGEPA